MPYRRTYRKFSRKNKRKRFMSKKAIKRLVSMAANLSPLCRDRYYDTGYLSCTANTRGSLGFGWYKKSDMNGLIQNAGPALLVGADSAGYESSASQEFRQYAYANADSEVSLFYDKSSYAMIRFRNNDLVDAEIQFTLYRCVDDTANAPVTELLEGYRLQRNDLTLTDLGTLITENYTYYNKYLDHWKVDWNESAYMRPGDEKVVYVKPGKGWYKYGVEGLSSSSTYAKGISIYLLVQIRGTLGHDTTTRANVGRLKVSLDYEMFHSHAFKLYQHKEKGFADKTETLDTITIGQQSHVDVAQEEPE